MKKIIAYFLCFLSLFFCACSVNAENSSHSSNGSTVSENSQESQSQNGEQETDGKSKADYIHVSFDDVRVCFENLAQKRYACLWDEPFFAWLKTLHEDYGVKFSLFTYSDVLRLMDNRYAPTFSAVSEWLKIGFHADTSGHNLSDISYEKGKSYWTDFVGELQRITGGADNFDRMPRLEFFSGSKDGLCGMRDAEYGALGFLSADDNRAAYYLDELTLEYLYTNDKSKDEVNGLTFFATDVRGDWFAENFTSTNAYRKPIKNTVYEELSYRERTAAFDGAWKSIIFFTHEWQIYDGQALNENTAWVTDVCRYAQGYEIAFAYPQDKI